MDNRKVASQLVKIAKKLIAASIKEGDVCKVNMRKVDVNDAGTGHHMKILRKIVKEGGGKVFVEKVQSYSNGGDMAEVTAYDNPMSRIMGAAWVNVEALTKVG